MLQTVAFPGCFPIESVHIQRHLVFSAANAKNESIAWSENAGGLWGGTDLNVIKGNKKYQTRSSLTKAVRQQGFYHMLDCCKNVITFLQLNVAHLNLHIYLFGKVKPVQTFCIECRLNIFTLLVSFQL